MGESRVGLGAMPTLAWACEASRAQQHADASVGHGTRLAQLRAEHEIRLSELAIVCANCHRMLHRLPLHAVEELRRIVKGPL